jgi:hypothetical protein
MRAAWRHRGDTHWRTHYHRDKGVIRRRLTSGNAGSRRQQLRRGLPVFVHVNRSEAGQCGLTSTYDSSAAGAGGARPRSCFCLDAAARGTFALR